MEQRTAFLGGAVAVALVVGVERDHDIDHGHHDGTVDENRAHVGEGPPRRPEQAEQAGRYQHDGVVDQGHGSLASGLDRRRRVIRDGSPESAYLHPHPAHRPPRVVHLVGRVMPRPIFAEVTRSLEAAERHVHKAEIGELEEPDGRQENGGPVARAANAFLVDLVGVVSPVAP